VRVFKLGIVGYGRWGRVVHRALAQISGFEVTAICNRSVPGDLPNDVRYFSCWKTMISDAELDLIYIAAPANMHTEIALFAIDLRVALIIEKPVTLSLSEHRQIMYQAEQARVCVVCNYIHLFSSSYQTLKKTLRETQETITSMTLSAGNAGPLRNSIPPLWDWAPHDISLVLDLMHELPKSVCCKSRDLSRLDDKSLNVDITLSFDDDITAHIYISNLLTSKERLMDVTTSGVTYTLDGTKAHPDGLLINSERPRVSDTEKHPCTPLEGLFRYTYSCLLSSDCKTDLDLSYNITKVLSACDLSNALSGKSIHLL